MNESRFNACCDGCYYGKGCTNGLSGYYEGDGSRPKKVGKATKKADKIKRIKQLEREIAELRADLNG